MNVQGKPYRTVWLEGAVVRMIDQPKIPHRFEIIDLPDYHATAHAIRTMIVRGAPAIGASGAYGMAQAVLSAPDDAWKDEVAAAAEELAATRPTAQDLFDAIARVRKAVEDAPDAETARARAVEADENLAGQSVRRSLR